MSSVSVALVIVVLVAFFTGCAPSVQQQRSARLEAFQLELNSTLETWKADVSLRRFSTSADAARSLVARYDIVYDRWGLRPDPLTQAVLSYAVAVAGRVDQRDVSVDEANALLSRMRADTDQARSKLAATYAESPVTRKTAMFSWWKDYWATNQRAFQITNRNPIQCEMGPTQTNGNPVRCH
jgi:hypothetical protein